MTRIPASSPADSSQLIGLYNSGHFAELESKALLLVDQYPDYGFGWKLLGSALQKQGKNALLALRKAAEFMPGEAETHYNLANAQMSVGLLNEAVGSYRRALQIDPDYADAYLNLGNALVELEQLDDAAANYRRALQLRPGISELHIKLGNVLADLGLFEDAATSYRLAIQINPDYAEAYYFLGNVLEEPGQREEAVAAYHQALRFNPDFAAAHNRLGMTFKELGQFDAALACYRQALALKKDYADAHHNLGVILEKLGQFDAAVESFRRALELKPDFAEAHHHLGNVLDALGQYDDARASHHNAVKIRHRLAEVHNRLGANLMERGSLKGALANFRRAIDLKPDFARAHMNLGVVLMKLERFEEAASRFRLALEFNPDSADAYLNLGNAQRNLGHNFDALTSFRRALELKPDFLPAQSSLLFTQNYIALPPENCIEEARKYGRMAARKVTSRFSSWHCTTRPERLRVGIVSGDLYKHPVVYFLEALLTQVDASRIELFAYPTSTRVDEFTVRIKPKFAAWKPIHDLNDATAAKLIHADGVHILIDLSGHTSNNRLPVFAWKPAPVQVTWLGYFATTGLSEMDYLLADEVGVPESQREFFSESIWYLPNTRLCFSSPGTGHAIGPLPALSNDGITFGCFQNLAKLGDEVLEVWGNILAVVPNAKLRIQTYQLDQPAHVNQLMQRLQYHHITPAQVEIKGSAIREDYLAAYAEVDMVLDTFPYPGGTTTCEALWMGVPTLTLAGDTLLARQGASLLTAAGLSDWVVNSKVEYISRAVALASDLPRLAALRSNLRQQVLASALFDAPGFAKHFESALWKMWQIWGKSNKSV